VRFVEEARVGSRIASEHVVETVGAGVDETTGAPTTEAPTSPSRAPSPTPPVAPLIVPPVEPAPTPEAPEITPPAPASPAITTVEAGPLWDHDYVLQTCPGRCADRGARWTGEWWTTVPNVMSVCQCASP
jgi:hypothetical protein